MIIWNKTAFWKRKWSMESNFSSLRQVRVGGIWFYAHISCFSNCMLFSTWNFSWLREYDSLTYLSGGPARCWEWYYCTIREKVQDLIQKPWFSQPKRILEFKKPHSNFPIIRFSVDTNYCNTLVPSSVQSVWERVVQPLTVTKLNLTQLNSATLRKSSLKSFQ